MLSVSPLASAEFSLSSNLTQNNREQILKILGLGTSGKNISIPMGLGTDHGLEISLANEFINTEKISQFITDERSQNTLYYPKISIGKGIYSRTDLFIHFIPYTATLGLSEFGGTIRYNFFKPSDSIISMSAVLNLNSSNFNNQITTRALSGDLSIGMNWKYFSLFSSIGHVKSTGTFTGGSQGTTDTSFNETESVSNFHYSVGALTRYKIYFVSAALDHYTEPVYSLKIGCYL
ncbi:MAG: hypothetical protein IT287_02370 [Bdellovibrionaceae bacterium]|nr:hypothetical protein [Pseudobdellovibrionaceae bacterium]